MKRDKKEINILFASNSNYFMPLTVGITSVFENNKENKIVIYVFYNNLEKNQENILLNLAKTYNQKINLIKVTDHYFNSAPTPRWSKETYYRLLIVELLPKDLQRILYLDCDIIVNKPLNDLYEIDLDDKYLAATIEKNDQAARVRLGLNINGNYYQSGVVLFNINKCRSVLNYEQITRVIKVLGSKLLIVDQDVINVMFDNKIIPLDQKFNNHDIINFCNNNTNRLFNKIDKKNISETFIFHYVIGKPWNNLYAGSCEDIWYKYLLLSPYKDLYYKKYTKFKYKILRAGIVKLLFYEYIKITPYINNFARKIFPSSLYNVFRDYYRKKIK